MRGDATRATAPVERVDSDADSQAHALRRAALDTSRSVLALQRQTEADLRGAKQALEHQAKELADSLSLLNATLEAAPDPIVAIDLDGRAVVWNERYEQLLELSPEALASRDTRTWAQAVLPKLVDPERFLREHNDARRRPDAPAVQTVELLDGRVLERWATPQRLRGECVGTVVQWRDVTERNRSEAALRQSQQRLQALFDHALNAIVLADDEGCPVDVNAAACTLLGREREALIGRPAAGLVAEPLADGAASFAEAWQQFVGRGRHSGTMRLCRPDGSTAVAEYSAVADVQPGLHLVVLSDVTEKRRAREMRVAKEAAEAANRSKSDFVSRMSHELRTPLNAILGFSEVLLLDDDEPLTPRQRLHAERIRSAGSHLLALIEDVLDVSRIETGSLRLKLETVHPFEAVSDTLRNLAMQAEARDVELVVVDDAAARRARVEGDRTRLAQVLFNLVSNGIKYNRPGGRVTATIEPAGERVRLRIADTGLGMDDDQLERLFRPFDRLGREGSAVEGTGIGLVISRNLTELMGGTLGVTSRAGHGSEFVVELRSADAGDTTAAMPLAARDAVPATPALTGRVLYIDDDEVNRLLMQAFVAMRPGVALELACDGGTGLEMARDARPSFDLMLVDMRLPDMTGIDVVQRLAVGAGRPRPRCIAVSAEAMPDQIAAAIAAGFDGYLTKPLGAATLLAALEAALG